MKKHSQLGVFKSKGRLNKEPTSKYRSPFQRDRDRIIHSASFRRLKHKTQVFVNTEGDHFRTRITHSIEVAQIARSIAKYLNLNEDLTDQIVALPNHHTAEDTEDATLVVGKYAVVHYDESDEGGEDMYVVWDNTVNQDEIGSYDDEPEFESTDPAEVAIWLKQNA